METKILIIDTASGSGHIALASKGSVCASRDLSAPRRQAEEIFPAIAALLESRELRLENLTAITVATGPGSFTSLRVGLTAAKSLSEAAHLPLIGISNIEAAARLSPGFPAVIILPASRGEYFYATAVLVGVDGEALEKPVCSPAELVEAEGWIASLGSPPRYIISTSNAFLDLAAERLSEESRCILISPNLLEPIASIAECRFVSGEFDDPLLLDAAYARKHDADSQWHDPRLEA
ncbi:MAG: tRNA (adenosine(37)-N6)-threonylcarbamoyltransferase complex dimerization subunit type 1 TsaB [Bryobacterales bacterium]|nr:tRNA (adenosine(37)-N6)-threonylcarbamoyltransferase complex dimerization subunit type 1 TsaB [Bryobacterales bacterium]